jgi:hypothetical protein
MQDIALANIANFSITALEEVSGQKVLPPRLWLHRSPDLNLYDYYLWGTLNVKSSEQPPFFASIERLYLQRNGFISRQGPCHVSRSFSGSVSCALKQYVGTSNTSIK